MRKFALSLIVVGLALSPAAFLLAQDDPAEEEPRGRHYFVNFSLYHPVSLNRSKHDRVNLNLSLIYGRVGYVSGLDFSLMASGVEHHMEGVQLCGLIAVAGESGKGWQSAGLIAVAGERFTGFQASGLITVAGEDLRGVQLAGLLSVAGHSGRWLQAAGLGSVAGETYRGVQLSGGFNVIGERGEGFQAAGLFNVTGERFSGVQAAGLFNVIGNDFEGLQLGTMNVAVHSRGVQIGLANIAETGEGLQLGLVNYTKKDNTGLPIGAVNIARNGSVRGIAWAGMGVPAAAGVRCRIGRIYSIASLGFGNWHDEIGASVTYGIHYGVAFPLGGSELGVDAGYRFRDNTPLFKRPDPQPDQHMLETRLLWTLPLSKRIFLVLGTGLGHRFDTGRPIDSGKAAPLLAAGIEFF